jgi:hypothetical protein
MEAGSSPGEIPTRRSRAALVLTLLLLGLGRLGWSLPNATHAQALEESRAWEMTRVPLTVSLNHFGPADERKGTLVSIPHEECRYQNVDFRTVCEMGSPA